MKDRLEKAVELVNKVCKACDKYDDCDKCPYDNKRECGISDAEYEINKLDSLINKELCIQLKNIDLSGVTTRDQYKKAAEEKAEYLEALSLFIHGMDTKEHVIEELWDRIQAELGILEKRGITADEVMAEYPKHLLKMESRGNKPREKVKHNE